MSNNNNYSLNKLYIEKLNSSEKFEYIYRNHKNYNADINYLQNKKKTLIDNSKMAFIDKYINTIKNQTGNRTVQDIIAWGTDPYSENLLEGIDNELMSALQKQVNVSKINQYIGNSQGSVMYSAMNDIDYLLSNFYSPHINQLDKILDVINKAVTILESSDKTAVQYYIENFSRQNKMIPSYAINNPQLVDVKSVDSIIKQINNLVSSFNAAGNIRTKSLKKTVTSILTNIFSTQLGENIAAKIAKDIYIEANNITNNVVKQALPRDNFRTGTSSSGSGTGQGKKDIGNIEFGFKANGHNITIDLGMSIKTYRAIYARKGNEIHLRTYSGYIKEIEGRFKMNSFEKQNFYNIIAHSKCVASYDRALKEMIVSDKATEIVASNFNSGSDFSHALLINGKLISSYQIFKALINDGYAVANISLSNINKVTEHIDEGTKKNVYWAFERNKKQHALIADMGFTANLNLQKFYNLL